MVQNRRLDPRTERRDAGTSVVFQDVEDPSKGNAKRRDLHEMLVIALLSMLTGGRTCVDMEDYGNVAEPWLRKFLTLENGIPSHDTFSRLFANLVPAGLQKALLCLTQDWADRLGDVVAVDGKALRRSFEDASEKSPTHLLLAVRGGVEADAGAYWRWTASRTRSRRCWNCWT